MTRQSVTRRTIYVAIIGMYLTFGAFAQQSIHVEAAFPLDAIERIVLRASAAEQAKILERPGSKTVEISGVPSGGAPGYHSPDPNWKETPATEWGLDFVAIQYGKTLVISTMNEFGYIHHRYTIRDILVELPHGIELVRQRRQLTGDGAPDLSPP